MINDRNLELKVLSSLSGLTTYDITEARKFVDQGGVSEVDFSDRDCWVCYSGIVACIGMGIAATPDNLHRALVSIEPSRAAILTKLAFQEEAMGHELEAYTQLLVELSERRETAMLLEDALESVRNPKKSASEQKFRLVNALQRSRGKKSTKGLDSYVSEVEKHMEDVAAGRVKPVIPWYLPKIDKAIGGLQPTLILIGAEPGVGKSALIASAVNLQAKHGHKPFVASLEDSPDWLAWRLVSNDINKNQFAMRFNKMSDVELNQVRRENEKLIKIRESIRVIDASVTGIKIEDLVSSANDAIVNEGCDSVWIDHLGEILLSSSERTDLEISRHLSLLRGVANRHHVPVVVAAHFKRAEDLSKPPTFRDFANSSGSERKARVALGLRRNPGSDTLSVHVMKQTNGPAGQVIDLTFGGAAAMIYDTEGGYGNAA
jgi:replicative DNA helicase